MKTKVRRWTLVMIAGGTLCVAALASEHEQAQAACERVSPLFVAEQQRSGHPAIPLPCLYFTEPPAYWQCMEETLHDGNPWRYAEAQCNEKRRGG